MVCATLTELCTSCESKRARWQHLQSVYAVKAEKEVLRFRKAISQNENKLTILTENHYKQRLADRDFSNKDVFHVLMYGKVVERNEAVYQKGANSFHSILISGQSINNQPLHLVIRVLSERCIVLWTVYDPSHNKHKWNEDYTERRCFC